MDRQLLANEPECQKTSEELDQIQWQGVAFETVYWMLVRKV